MQRWAWKWTMRAISTSYDEVLELSMTIAWTNLGDIFTFHACNSPRNLLKTKVSHGMLDFNDFKIMLHKCILKFLVNFYS